MATWHGDGGRKVTGGRIRLHRKKKRKYELGREPTGTRLGEEKKKVVRTKGGGMKVRALTVEYANVTDPETKETRRVKVLGVVENPANPHLVRFGVVTRGCVIRTELGRAKVTSRPSQEGVVNAVLLKEG